MFLFDDSIRPFLICVGKYPRHVALSAALLATTPAMFSVEAGVDPSIKPGDDFFAYANGDWLKSTTLPAGKQKWSAKNDIDIVTNRHIAEVLADASSAPAGSVGRKVADFRSAYIDETAIETRGLAPVAPILEQINSVKDKSDLTRYLGRDTQADVDPLNWGVNNSSSVLGLSVEPGINGETTYVAFLLQGGLGLPDRENYLSADPKMVEQRKSYTDYIAQLLTAAGFDKAADRAQAVMTLETALAQSQATSDASADDHNAANLWAMSDFPSRAPGMDWSEFFAAAGLGQQKSIVVWQQSAAMGVASLVSSQPLAVWQDYLRFHALDRFADVLPRAFSAPAVALHGLATAREDRALTAAQPFIGEGLGHLYADKCFPPEAKARLQGIIVNVEAALRRRVESTAWMSPATKAIAAGKIETLYVGLGYPEKWQDYSDYKVDPADAFGNIRRGQERNYRRELAQIGQPVDMKDWWMTPQTVGAVLLFQQNALIFPAALLQPPKFDPAASDAALYGSIGSIIGHESSHFVDPIGADYEAGGRKRRWWKDDDAKNFKAASAPLVREYSAYHPYPDVAENGELSSSENIADLAGVSSAFEAYRLSLGAKASDKEYVHQHDREFFIAWARSWRSKATEASIRKQAATNDHAPEMYRIATVRNIDAWYEAFDVQPGDRLYLEPQARVRVW